MKIQNHSEFNTLPQEYQKEPVEFVMPEEQYHQAKSEFNEDTPEQAKPVNKRSIRSMLKYALGTVATVAVVGTSFNSINNIGEEIITDPGKEYSYYSKNTLSINDRSIAVIKEDGSICLYGEDHHGIDGMCYTNWGNAQPVSIDVGETAAVVVYDDGTVQGYGSGGAWINGEGMTNDYTDIVDAVCVRNTSILLKDDGTVISTSQYDDLFDKCETWQDIIDIEGYANSVVGLKKDGSVCYAGYDDYLSDEISNWRDIVKIKCNYDTIVGVKADATVLTAGEDSNDLFQEVSAWTDIVDVSVSGDIFGLKSDGTVVATGQDPKCEVSGWSDVVAIDSTYETTVGLKADGTLLIAGGEDVGFTKPYTIDNAKSVDLVTFRHDKYTILCVNKDGTVSANDDNEYFYRDWTSIKKVSGAFGLTEQGKVLVADKNSSLYDDLADCENIIDISGCGDYSCVALKNDGTVVCFGFSDDFDVSEVSSWNNISSVYNNGDVIVGVKTDGTVVLTASDDYYDYHKEIIKEWRDICGIAFCGGIVGLKKDGTICWAGYGSENGLPYEECSQWNDIIKISGGYSHLIGLRSDGTVVAAGDNFANQCDVDSWTEIVDIDACEQATVGVRADGTIVAVGYNCDGLCNTSGVTNVRLPDGYGDFRLNGNTPSYNESENTSNISEPEYSSTPPSGSNLESQTDTAQAHETIEPIIVTEEPQIEYVEFPQLEGEVTLLEELPFEGGSIVTAYMNTVVARDSEGAVGIYDISGNLINDRKYNDNISWSYTDENPYIVLRRTEGNREYADLYSADGTLKYSNLEDYFSGTLIYRDGPDVVEPADDYLASVYRFVDENNGETLYTFDEEEYLSTHDSGHTLIAYCQGYNNTAVIMMSIFPTDSTYDYIFVSRNNVLSARELLKDHGIEDITFLSGSYLHYGSDKIYLRYYDNNHSSLSHIIIDTVTGELIDLKMPGDARFEVFNYSYNGAMAFYLDKQNWVAYQLSEDSFVIADLNGNILIDDVNGIYNAGDYLLLSEKDGVRYYNPKTFESISFDSISYFEGEYAFAVKDGMGYFINKNFEPVSSSTPATRADILSYSNIIYLEAQNKYYTYG